MSTPRPWKQFIDWQLIPPAPPSGIEAFTENVSRELIWRELLQLADVAKVGRALFAGTAAQKTKLWDQFGSLIRQAKAYDDAAALVRGPSAALLQYYTALNLAKAELLTAPSPLHAYVHGLKFSSARARSIAQDYLTVDKGVFPLLYTKRTGVSLRPGTRLSVKRLLASIPEIGWELGLSHFTQPTHTRLLHAAVVGAKEGWAVIAIENPAVILRSPVSRRAFLAAFEQVTPLPAAGPTGFTTARQLPTYLPGSDRHWTEVFATSRRFGYGVQTFFESRWQVPVQAIGTNRYLASVFATICAKTNATLGPFIDLPSEEGADATLTPSHLGNRMLPMPAGLARYAVMFYLSSLVRYKPTHVDLNLNSAQHWLMSAFADQAGIRMLQSMLSGITGRWHIYYSPGAFRA